MSGGNSAYSPLPQSNSDSDGSSEEELHGPQENKVTNRVPKLPNLKTDKAYVGQKQNIINYKPLDEEGDLGVTMIKFQSNSDEVSIVKPSNSSELFSTSRKICFTLSLLLCIFTTVVFIWVLPCDIETCLSPLNAKSYLNIWDKTFLGLELYGPISTTIDLSGNSQNIVFLSKNASKFLNKNSFEGGLISLKGNNGEVIWQVNLLKEATNIDCQLLDVNLDGFNDCLVTGKSFMKVIDSLSGKELWDLNNSNKNEIEIQLFDFPIIVPDFDNDQVKDLLSYGFIKMENKLKTGFQNEVVIISGRTGTIIKNPKNIENISKQYTMHHQQKEQKTVGINGRRLILKNQGNCPEDCMVLVDVKDERKGFNNKTIYSLKYGNTFGMTPIVVNSKNVNGFILKFWKWRFNRKKLKLEKSVNLDREMLMENNPNFRRAKRTAENLLNNKLNATISEDLNLRVVTETLIGITFNNSHPLLSNITEDEIIQICRKGQSCEPDVHRQKQSILIADLNKDERQEIISFTSKYVHDIIKSRNSDENWRLQSRVRVLSI